MAITNYERVGKALELLREGLRPFVERELEARHGKYWITKVTAAWPNDLNWPEGDDEPQMDAAVLLRVMWDQWNVVFRDTLGSRRAQPGQRAARRAQQVGAPGALLHATTPTAPSIPPARLLTAISAPQADEIEKMKMELLRAALRRAGAQREAQERRHRHREPGHGQPQALARSGHAAPGCGQRPLPAGRVRRRPVAGASGRRHRRIPRPGRVLPPHLSHREPEGHAGRRGAAPRRARAATRWCSSRPTSAAARPTRCWRSITSSPASRPPSWPASMR